VFAMLDGKYEAAVGLESVFRNHFHALRSGQRMSGSYFDVRYYPGVGTIHFFPTNKTLIDRMNRLVGNHRRWLPPAENKAGNGFWQQFDQAEKLDKAFRTEVNKHGNRDGRHVYFDPFWAVKYGGESERERGNAMLTQAMSTVLANHGIDPDAVLENAQFSLLEWAEALPLDTDLALAS
jgi:hypothetical protein